MLKPDKWQTVFDSDGKILGFQKVLKLIMLGVGFYHICVYVCTHMHSHTHLRCCLICDLSDWPIYA